MALNDQQITNKQHAVPQNIMDVEFKLIGDLTMRQFFYLLVTGIFAYAAFALLDTFLKWFIVLGAAGLGIVLAFIPIEDRGLDEWITNFFKAIYLPNQRIWKKDPVIPSAFNYQNINVVKQELITLTPTTSRRQLEEYLESYGPAREKDPLDIQEEEYINKVRLAFANAPVYAAVEQTITYKTTQNAPAQSTVVVSDEPVQQVAPAQQPQIEPKRPETSPRANNQQPAQEKPQKERFKLNLPKRTGSEPKPLLPISPDRHSGRKFTSLLPKQGEIILPIRGEKILKTLEEDAIEEDVKTKADQLLKLLGQIKKEEGIADIKTPQPKPTETAAKKPEVQVSNEAKELAEKIKDENTKLREEITQLQAEIQKEQKPQEKSLKEQILQKLLQKQNKTQEDYDVLKKQIAELQQKLAEKESTGASSREAAPNSSATPKYAQIQPLTTEPNIISGIIKDDQGVALAGVVAIVKNDLGEPVRAIKSNSLGQFKITTPLSNGAYIIDIDKSNVTGCTFDIIRVNADGKVIPPIEFAGKK